MTFPPHRARRAGALLLATAVVSTVAACGGSSKPAYCQDRDNLKSSIAGLKDVDVRQNGTSALKDQLKQVQSDANALVKSAQNEFGPDAAALKSAVGVLNTTVRQAAAAPSAQAVSQIVTQIGAVQDAFTKLSDDVGSKC